MHDLSSFNNLPDDVKRRVIQNVKIHIKIKSLKSRSLKVLRRNSKTKQRDCLYHKSIKRELRSCYLALAFLQGKPIQSIENVASPNYVLDMLDIANIIKVINKSFDGHNKSIIKDWMNIK